MDKMDSQMMFTDASLSGFRRLAGVIASVF
jgi:hypothetical protein